MGKISCFYCNRKCKGDVLKVGEKYFHKECFTCKVCHNKMENTGFFCKDDSFYCLDDYKKYCASICFACNEKIIGEVVTALGHTFHKECFKCSICHKCFSPGDRVSMRMSAFLCNQCCEQPGGDKGTVDTKPLIINSQLLGNGYNSLIVSDNKNKDSQISTIPIRRKNMSNNPLNCERMLSNSSTNLPLRITDNDLDSSVRSSLVTTPKHFHLPAGNNRSWSSSFGSKAHPLASSTNNINQSLSNSFQKINNTDLLNKDIKERVHMDKEDISPPASSILSEKSRRKIQNPTVEALSAGTMPTIRKDRSISQSVERESKTLSRMRLSEVLDKSAAEHPPSFKNSEVLKIKDDVPRDPISASRSPSAVREPLAPPRYDDHTETSPSRNDEYFRGTNRHLGYSMEYINSTNRSLVSENTIPGYRRSLRNSSNELRFNDNTDFNGLKRLSGYSNRNDCKSLNRNSNYCSDQLLKDTASLGRVKTIPYDQLRVSTLKMIRHINKANLESYLSDEEFVKLFQLTKPAFYQLPEWKRNDLKKKIDLF